MPRVGDYLHRVAAGRPRERKTEIEPAIPPERMAQVQAVLRRRVTDAVEDAFRRACLAADLATAGDLLVVLERMGERGARMEGGNRRLIPARMAVLRCELERCQVLALGLQGEVS